MLLAKSADINGGSSVSLQAHSTDVVRAMQQLRLIWPRLPKELEAAAQFHDFGKATLGFQKMLNGGDPWRFRHEIVSAAIFRDCFDVASPDINRAYLALLTHHKNLGGHAVNDAFLEAYSDLRYPEYSQWFHKWGELLHELLVAEFPSDLASWGFNPLIESPANEALRIMDELEFVFDDLQTALARGALVAADHLASAGLPPTLMGYRINEETLRGSLDQQLRNRGERFTHWSMLQEMSRERSESALLIAPTGAGKTEAALLWAVNNRAGGERIFYVLPYQVSINAMASRLAEIFPDETGRSKYYDDDNIAILHGNMELSYLQDALNDEVSPAHARAIAKANRDASRKIFAPFKIATVYQLLNLFFGRKFFEVGLLELTDSLVIFDEVHAYDGHTMGLLLVLFKYLRQLGARVFIMTATLPRLLEQQLASAAAINPVDRIEIKISDPLRAEVRRRICSLGETIEDKHTVSFIQDAMARGERVAVVCNTVRKAMQMRELLSAHSPYLLHSRFTYGDRASRETKTEIERCMSDKRVVIATQIIEVSLDVSFDSMFTELAPADALLQRFGRVNRHGSADVPSPVYVTIGADKGSSLIYGDDLLVLTKQWIASHIESRGVLNFDTSLDWIDFVYPSGLPAVELDAMQQAQRGLLALVGRLKPMCDAPIDADLELSLFKSIEVVPSLYETSYIDLKQRGLHLDARKLIVNVDLRAWRGAAYNAQQAGVSLARSLNVLQEKKDMTIANCTYTSETGLDLLSLNDQSDNNYF